MRKYTGILSITLLLAGVSILFLAKYFDFLADNMLPITITSYLLALLLVLISEKGRWKTIALSLLVPITLLVIGFYAVMTLFWNQP